MAEKQQIIKKAVDLFETFEAKKETSVSELVMLSSEFNLNDCKEDAFKYVDAFFKECDKRGIKVFHLEGLFGLPWNCPFYKEDNSSKVVKYKYEKFQIKAGRKSYILSQHEGENWAGPVVEHFVKENATKIGVYSDERKFLFELAVLNPEGTEYTVKICKDGYPNGPTIVMANETMFIGRYYAKDGFNGIVYRFKKGERVRIQEYKHGLLMDECLNDYVMYEDVGMPIPFDCFYENYDVVERKKNTKEGTSVEYIAGDPTSHQYILGACVDSKGNIRIGQFKNNAFDGFVLEQNKEDNISTFCFYDNGKQTNKFKMVYLPEVNGYAIVLKKEDLGFTDIVYCEKDKKQTMSIMDLNAKEQPIKDGVVELPNEIDPEAERPYGNEQKKHKPKRDDKGLTALEKLQKMIGLSNIKDEIIKLKAVLEKTPGKIPNLNMAFYGNPGTGKTEVARLLAEILYDEGILPSNKCVETDRSGLVAEYIGQTAIKTHKVVESAIGGVLFIDEAYSLKPSDEKDFGSEAIDALIEDMENYRGKMCFILAGYKQPLLDMIDTNKGFKSRVTRMFEFKDYTKEELKEIAKIRLESDGYIMSDEVLDETIKIVSKKMFSDDFGNARDVRNVLEKLYEFQALRTVETNKKDKEITIDDIQAYGKKDEPKKIDNLTAEERLENLIGLSSVKKEILKLKAFLAKSKDSLDKTNLHMCFYGNPGTGKTEVARLLANILYDEGILPENNFIEAKRNDLVGKYAGETAIKTHKLIKDAIGGVLFIDEAYSLGSDTVGKEAIDTLVADMENYRGKVCVILAGYESQMKEMLSLNPGMPSRINRNITFPDYSKDELEEITKLMVKSKKYTITDESLGEVIKIVEHLRKNADFANARTVRNILESIYEIQALRTYKEGISDSWLIKLCDVQEYEKDHDITFEEANKQKHDFKLSIDEFIDLSENYNDNQFTFSTDAIEQSSVNIKVENNGKHIGEGSGFFISPKGIIATCAHVVKDADKISVIVNIKTATNQYLTKDYPAEVIAYNENDDVAIIGILGANFNFNYYPLSRKGCGYPKLMTEIAMGGYPFGGDRFETITITEGKVQSINKDSYTGTNNTNIYVDLSGQPGSSGSGVIDVNSGRCIGIFAGAAIGHSSSLKLTINYAVPVRYLWDLIEKTCNPDYQITSGLYESKLTIDEDKISSMSTITKKKISVVNSENIENSNLNSFEDFYKKIHIVKGDISTFEGDAVVNAANKYLAPGAGVCGAIFKRAGYRELEEACKAIGECEVGHAAITKGFELKAKYIIHAVGPRYEVDRNPERLLASVYESSFDVAISHNIKSIAFPSISTGIYGFPKELAVPIALKEIFRRAHQMDDIFIYCFDDRTYQCYLENFERLIKNL